MISILERHVFYAITFRSDRMCPKEVSVYSPSMTISLVDEILKWNRELEDPIIRVPSRAVLY